MTLTQINKAGLDELALDHVFTIGASGTDHYTFQGEGLNGTVNDPTLYLTRGKTYRFENGTGAHPIRIQSADDGTSGTLYNTGVTNNNTAGTVIVEVQHDAPDVLYYQCASHANMKGTIYVTGALADGGVTTAKIANNAVVTASIADDAITNAKIADGAVGGNQLGGNAVTAAKIGANEVTSAAIAAGAVGTAKIADQAVTLDKLPHGTGSTDGKFLRANNGADPSFESIPDGITVGNAADERVVTSDGTNLDAESLFVYKASNNTVGIGTSSPEPTASYYQGACLHIHQAASGGSVGAQVHLSNDYGGSGEGDGSQVSHYNHHLYINNQENGDTYFYNNGSSNLTIKADGKVGVGTQSPSQELHVNGDVQASSIFLGGTGSANQLDDYEEGTWTPTNVNFGTYNNVTWDAKYTKIGNLVFINAEMTGGDVDWSTYDQISGLPFQVIETAAGSWTTNGPAAGGEILLWDNEHIYFANDFYGPSSHRLRISAFYITNA